MVVYVYVLSVIYLQTLRLHWYTLWFLIIYGLLEFTCLLYILVVCHHCPPAYLESLDLFLVGMYAYLYREVSIYHYVGNGFFWKKIIWLSHVQIAAVELFSPGVQPDSVLCCHILNIEWLSSRNKAKYLGMCSPRGSRFALSLTVLNYKYQLGKNRMLGEVIKGLC